MSGKKDGTSSLEEIIASEKAKASSAAHRPWHDHVDRLIEERLSVAAMARVFDSMGIKVGRRTVNDWLLRNRKESTEYLRVKRGVDHKKQNGKVEPVVDKAGEAIKETPNALSAVVATKEIVNDNLEKLALKEPQPTQEAEADFEIGLSTERVLSFINDPRNRI